jgi:ribonuclease HI
MTPIKIYFDGGCKPNPGEREVTAPTTERKGSPHCRRSI